MTLDHMHIDVRLGGDAAFDRLTTACRDMGLPVILDGVFNHVSRNHPAVQAALDEAAGQLKPADNPWHGLVHAHVGDHGEPALDVFEGHGDLVALDHGSDETVDYVARVMNHWLDRGAAGWRLDAAYAVPSQFWARVLPQVKAVHLYSWVFGEVIHGDYPRIIEESTMDSLTQYELWKSIQHALETENFFELNWNLKRHNAFLDSFVPQTFIGNHDVTRIASQIGPAKAALALAVLMTVGGVPSIYYGDEQGYVGVKQERFGGDDDIRPKFPDSPAELSTLGEPTYRLHQALIALRHRNPWLIDARTEAVKLENKHFIYRSASADAQHSLTVDLNIEQSPTFTIRHADGSIAYQY